MSRIFLSHASQDSREAMALKKWLIEQDSSLEDEIFLDLDPHTGILPGVRWMDALKQAHARCEAVICLLSPSWEASHWCKTEYQLAEMLNKPVFSARIDPAAGLNLTAEWQCCDLFGDGATTAINIGDGNSVAFASIGLDRLWKGITDAGIAAETFVWPPPNESNRAPYRGWDPFSEVDAGVFFGRDAQIVLALDALRGMRRSHVRTLFVVLGPSGSGKSSFLRAGLLPRLRRDDRRFLLLDVVRPERNALTGETGLAAAIHATRERLDLREPTLFEIKACTGDTKRVRELLLDCQAAAQARFVDRLADEPPPTLILPLDQAEELYSADAGPQASGFLKLLSELLSASDHAGLGMIVAATIRTDRYAVMQTAPELATLETQLFDDLKPMPATQFKEVISGPAARSSRGGRRLTLQPKLADRLLEDCAKGADTLPLLSLTLARLFRDFGSSGELTLAQYEAMGGMAHVVQTEVDGVLARDPAQRASELATLREAFVPWLATINPNNDQPLRRVARWDDLPEGSRPLIDEFVAKRLMVKDERDGEVVVEVALESLLRQWDELDGWLRQESENLKEADNLEHAAAAWQKNDRNDAWLMQGTRLAEAETLSNTTGFRDRLATVRDYLAASRQRENDRQEAERQRQEAELRNAQEHAAVLRKRARVLRAVLAAAVVVALVAVIGFVQAYQAKREADARTREATTLRLVSEAQSMLGDVRPGGDVRAFQQLLAAHAIGGGSEGAMLDALVRRFNTLKIADAGAKVNGVALSPDGKRSATANEDNTVRFWNTDTGQPIGQPLTGHQAAVTSVAYSPDGHRIATASADKTARLWNTDTGQPIGPPLTGHQAAVTSVAYSPDGHRIATGSWDHTVRVWNADTGQSLGNPFTQHQGQVLTVAFSPDGQIIASGGTDKSLRLWNPGVGTYDIANMVDDAFDIGPTSTGAGIVWSVAFAPEGRHLSGSSNRAVRLGVLNPLEFLPGVTYEQSMTGHQDKVTAAAFSPDGHRLVTGSSDRTMRVWDTGTDRELKHSSAVYTVAVSPDGNLIAAAGFDKTVRIWNAATGESVGEPLSGNRDSVTSLAFSPDGHRLAGTSFDHAVRQWDVDTGRLIGQWIAHAKGAANSVAFSPDGQRLATAGADKTVRLWNAETGEPIGQPLTGHQNGVRDVAFSPDGRRLATVSLDESVRLWNAETGEPIGQPLTGHQDGVLSVAFSPDGRRIATAGADTTVRLWNAETGEPIGQPLTGHQDDVLSVAFSPDGRRIATAGVDKTVRLWDAETGQSIGAAFTGHEAPVWSVAFTPDGESLISGSEDWTLRVWPAVATPEMLCAKLTTNMSRGQWDEWVSPDIDYIELCPGLPIAPV